MPVYTLLSYVAIIICISLSSVGVYYPCIASYVAPVWLLLANIASEWAAN